MSFIASSLKRSGTASSKPVAEGADVEVAQGGLFQGDRLDFDLSAHLTYMSAVATAGLTRDKLFEQAAQVQYVTAPYFRSIRLLTTKLGYNYPRALEVVASKTKPETMKSFLLRFAGSLGSGEREGEFLARESEVQFETHRSKYERDLEGLRKWTDGFVALEVSVALVIIIAIVSLMIFPLGLGFVVGLCLVGAFIAVLGGYVIYRSCPPETFTHNMKVKSAAQVRTKRLAGMLIPAAFLMATGSWLALGPGAGFLAIGAVLLPVGWKANKYHIAIDKRDRDVAAFLRAVGGVTSAVGTTVTEAIGKLDLRSMGALEPEVERLYHRLKSGIRADLCWDRFVAETGSELIRRSVRVFWDGIKAGGDASRIGFFASLFAMHISMLRQKRALVANTFSWLMLPMHGTIIALLMFITEVITLFSQEMAKAQASNTLERPAEADLIPAQDFLAFGSLNMGFVQTLVILLVLLLTVVNGWVPNAAAGGDRYRFFFPFSLMSLVSGVNLIVVPFVVGMLFGGLVASPIG